MEENKKIEQTPEELAKIEKDRLALQVKVTAQVATLTDEEKMLFNIYASEGQGPKISVPEIRINYDEDKGVPGGFLVIDNEMDESGNPIKKTTYVADEIEVTIMRTRFKYGFYDQDIGEKGMETLGTPEMDDYNGEVSLWDNQEKKVIFNGPYKSFKTYIQTNFPDARLEKKGFKGSTIKHTEILYVEYNKKIYRMYLSKTGRDGYWKYKEVIKGVPTFAFKSKLTTTKEKNGTVVYFPLSFEKTSDNQLKEYIELRKKLDEDLATFDKVREGVKGDMDENTVQGEDPEKTIIKKYSLPIEDTFVNPVCPTCNSQTVLRDSFKGPFFGCSDFPNCKGTVKLEDVINKEEVPTINVEEETVSPSEEATEDDIKVEDVPF